MTVPSTAGDSPRPLPARHPRRPAGDPGPPPLAHVRGLHHRNGHPRRDRHRRGVAPQRTGRSGADPNRARRLQWRIAGARAIVRVDGHPRQRRRQRQRYQQRGRRPGAADGGHARHARHRLCGDACRSGDGCRSRDGGDRPRRRGADRPSQSGGTPAGRRYLGDERRPCRERSAAGALLPVRVHDERARRAQRVHHPLRHPRRLRPVRGPGRGRGESDADDGDPARIDPAERAACGQGAGDRVRRRCCNSRSSALRR